LPRKLTVHDINHQSLVSKIETRVSVLYVFYTSIKWICISYYKAREKRVQLFNGL
jgi:hypothetical protein